MDLPSPIVDKILSRVPVEDLITAIPIVCRDFEERVHKNKDGFVDFFNDLHRGGWLLCACESEARVFDLKACTWLKIKLRLPDPCTKSLAWAGYGCFGLEKKGVLLLRRLGSRSSTEIPMEQPQGRRLCRAFLPPSPSVSSPSPSLIQFEGVKSGIKTSVYDGIKWQGKAGLNAFNPLSNVVFSPATARGYCLSCFYDAKGRTKYSVDDGDHGDKTFADLATYNLFLDHWTVMRTVLPKELAMASSEIVHVVESGGRVLLVGKVRGSLRLAVWSLTRSSSRWELTSIYPGEVTDYSCVAAGDILCFVHAGSRDLLCFKYKFGQWETVPGLQDFGAERIFFTQQLLS